MKKLLILGAGGYGKTIADVAAQLGCYDSIAFLDDCQTGDNILGKCGEFSAIADADTHVYPAFGNNEIRMQWIHRLEAAGLNRQDLKGCYVLVNGAPVPRNGKFKDGDVVQLLPPVAGG